MTRQGKREAFCRELAVVIDVYTHEEGKGCEEQFAEIMKHNAEKEYESFINKIDSRGLTIKPIFELAKKKNAETVEAIIKNDNVDLISIGSRGRSASAAILLGSMTEHLIWSVQVPIIAVKKKGANMHLIEAILKI